MILFRHIVEGDKRDTKSAASFASYYGGGNGCCSGFRLRGKTRVSLGVFPLPPMAGNKTGLSGDAEPVSDPGAGSDIITGSDITGSDITADLDKFIFALDRFFPSFSQNQPGFGGSSMLCVKTESAYPYRSIQTKTPSREFLIHLKNRRD
jgi:hypothetical protein